MSALASNGQFASAVPDFPWYAVRVRSNCEKTASQVLRHKGYCEFTPSYRVRRRWSDRMKTLEVPLFPGYVFCRFDVNERVGILTTPGVVSVVSFGQTFIPVDDAEIAAVQRAATSDAKFAPWPHLRVGQKVRVCGGALHGIEGRLLHLKNGRRLVLSLTLLQRSVAVEIDREDVEPVF